MPELVVQPAAQRYLKKLKDRQLKELFSAAIKAILANPDRGEAKTGDLKGLRSLDIYYRKTNYELAYKAVEVFPNSEPTTSKEIKDEQDTSDVEQTVVVVILAGTRENFYQELRRHMK